MNIGNTSTNILDYIVLYTTKSDTLFAIVIGTGQYFKR